MNKEEKFNLKALNAMTARALVFLNTETCTRECAKNRASSPELAERTDNP
jgi:hypothetical protein